jgi:hypothetical protein
MKKCPKCGENKELNLFYKNASLCIDCHYSYYKIYNQTPPGRYSTYKRGATKRGFTFTITMDEFMSLWGQNCFYCGDQVKGVGLDRVDSSIGYEKGNVVSCCNRCNRMKLTSTYKAFIEQCRKIVKLHDDF